MTADDGARSEANEATSRPGADIMAAFLGAIFLSAALIFVIQPMFTRFVLPRLGGSPGVWSVAMAFFQAVLFGGYLYAHLLSRMASTRRGVVVHLAVTTLALAWLPLGIAQGWGEPPSTGESIWLLGLFAASIGVPYFALSANGPLLQSWFARATEGTRADPYFLYAVSNAGSFLALLAYPLAIEPTTTLAGQSRMWTIAYAVLLVLIAACGALVWRRTAIAADGSVGNGPFAGTASLEATAMPPLAELAWWSVLAAVPTGLLIAVTAQISTDIAAIPLVWVVPLALYLLTLVIVFRSWSERSHALVAAAVPWALVALATVMVLMPDSNLEGWRFLAELGLHLGVFVLVSLMCHGELVRRRPPASQLTVFYLAMSFGGMVGGVLASMVAPQLFNWVAEYPILLVAAALCLPGGRGPAWSRSRAVQVAIGLAVAIILLPGLIGKGAVYQAQHVTTVIGAACLVAGALTWRNKWLLALMLATALASARLYPPEGSTMVTFRSFFGVHKVHDSEDGRHRLLLHGTTIHGAQRIRTATGEPEQGRPEPLTYYRVGSPIHEALTAVREGKGGTIRIAAVGLGAGSMACLIEAADQLTFFEIDTTVIEIARDPRRFTFISACRPNVPIVVGDARLTLARAADGTFDAIVVDAFASDAIPTHLLTREAMALYARKLAPGGMIVLHLSSRHMELVSVAHAVAKSAGLVSRGNEEDLPEDSDDEYKFDSTVVAVARSEADLGKLAKSDDWDEPTAEQLAVRAWTDDYANPLGAIWRHLRE